MGRFNELLSDPAPETLAETLVRASAAIDDKMREGRLERAPESWGGITLDGREGHREWLGGSDSLNFRAQLHLGWWTDHVGRKHVRIQGGPSHRDERQRLVISPLFAHPLWHVFPSAALLRRKAGEDELLVFCSGCGLAGSPASLGWVGTTCGPCADHREEGGRVRVSLPVLPAIPSQADFAWAGTDCILVYGHRFFSALETNTGRPVGLYRPDARANGMTEFGHSGWIAATPADDAKVQVHSISHKSTRVIDLPGDVFWLRFSPDDRWLAATGATNLLLDLAASDGAPKLWPRSRRLGEMCRPGWLPDGSAYFAVAANGALLRIARDTSGVLELPTDPANPFPPADGPDPASFIFDCSPDGQWLSVSTCSVEGSPLDGVRLLHLESNDWWVVRQGGVSPPAFSPDGHTLAIQERDGGIRFMDLATRDDLGTLHLHASTYGSPPFAFSPDGQTLAVIAHTVAGVNQEIRLLPWRELLGFRA